MEIGEIKEILC